MKKEENSKKESSTVVKLPSNFITVGEVEVDDVKVYIKQDVYKEIEKFSKEDTDHECGGILIGDYSELDNKKYVIISAFIEAKYTDASASTLTFTHETWSYIHEEQDELYEDKKIVGWQHTHPSYGIFLSNYDIFIQKNFFNLPWQIAYVVDPLAETRGFFQWKGDKVERINGFYIYDDDGVKIKERKLKAKESKEKFSISELVIDIVAILAMVLVIIFAFDRNKLIKSFNELKIANSKIAAENNKLSKEIIEEKKQSQSKTADVSEKNANDDVQDDSGIIKFKEYVIEDNDTLYTICSKNNLDYYKERKVIMRINNLSDENKIYSGNKIYLPMDV